MDTRSPMQASPHLINPWLPLAPHHLYANHQPETPRSEHAEKETQNCAPALNENMTDVGDRHTLRRPSSTPLILVTARTSGHVSPNEREGDASYCPSPIGRLRRSSSAIDEVGNQLSQHEEHLNNDHLSAPPGHKPSQAAYTTLFDVSTSHKNEAVGKISSASHDRWTMILELEELLRSCQHFDGHRDSLVLARQTLHRMSVSTILCSRRGSATQLPLSSGEQEEFEFDEDEVEVT